MNSPSCSDLTSELSSDLSSIGSLSPPPDYPTPPSSQDIKATSGQRLSQKRPADNDETPPAKKRKTVEPKPRTTQYLNLGSSPHSLATDQKVQLDTLLRTLRKGRRIIVVAGAGISVSAGIPDFRSESGLFRTLREEHKLKSSGKDLFDASVYQTDAATSSFHDMVRNLSEQATAAQPTEFHHMLAKLARDGRLQRLYTQNVDGIETSLEPLETTVPLSHKGPWPKTVQLHGGLEKMVCSKCQVVSEFEPALFIGHEAPPCNACIETDKIRTDHAGKRSHGIGRLRPRIVLYNEHNPDQEAIGAVMQADLRTRPDAIIVVGTTLKIPGVKRFVREMCGLVRDRKDGIAVWINHDPPPKEFDNCWDLVVRGECDNVASHVNLKRWDDMSVDYQECTESDVERVKAKNDEVKVIIETPANKVLKAALLTPAPSPRSKSAEVEHHKKPFLKLNGPRPRKRPDVLLHGQSSQYKGFSNETAKPTTDRQATITNRLQPKALKSKATDIKPSKPSNTKAAKGKKDPKLTSLNLTINNAFKVSKPQGTKWKRPKQVRLTPSDDELSPRAMAPISPSAARNNGPIVLAGIQVPIKSTLPDLPPSPGPSIENIHITVTSSPTKDSRPKQLYPMVKIDIHSCLERRSEEPFHTPLVAASELESHQIESSTGRLKTLSQMIVSPTSPPNGMRGLLN